VRFAPRYDPNEFQVKALPIVSAATGNGIVIAPTASGKTMLAEAVMHPRLDAGGALYVAPYRALVNEKIKTWEADPQMCFGGIGYDDNGFKGSLCCSTIERALSLVDSRAFSIVAVDELHFLGDKDRGHALEVLLTATPASLIWGFSGTLSNPKDLASWFKKLNGHSTTIIQSSWRPMKLEWYWHEVARYEEMKEVIKIIRSNPELRTIVFVQSKIIGKELVKRLRKADIQCAFHHAGAGQYVKDEIEAQFSMRYGDMKVIIATSTIAAGVNL